MRHRFSFWLLCLLVLCAAPLVLVRGQEPSIWTVYPGPIVRPFPVSYPAKLSIREIAVDTSVREGVAETTVTQTWRNDTEISQEGTYLFPVPDGAAVTLSGKSEAELRDVLGTPTSEEDRPPGKRWRYRDGQCTLDVQLYPDVQTKQFGTLAYEVKSDDNTDEGKRLCLAQIQSRVQARH